MIETSEAIALNRHCYPGVVAVISTLESHGIAACDRFIRTGKSPPQGRKGPAFPPALARPRHGRDRPFGMRKHGECIP